MASNVGLFLYQRELQQWRKGGEKPFGDPNIQLLIPGTPPVKSSQNHKGTGKFQEQKVKAKPYLGRHLFTHFLLNATK